jgi:hypothetical protein
MLLFFFQDVIESLELIGQQLGYQLSQRPQDC